MEHILRQIIAISCYIDRLQFQYLSKLQITTLSVFIKTLSSTLVFSTFFTIAVLSLSSKTNFIKIEMVWHEVRDKINFLFLTVIRITQGGIGKLK